MDFNLAQHKQTLFITCFQQSKMFADTTNQMLTKVRHAVQVKFKLQNVTGANVMKSAAVIREKHPPLLKLALTDMPFVTCSVLMLTVH